MTNQMKNIPAAQEDAKEEEQKIPKAGDVLTEQQAFFLKHQKEIVEQLVMSRIMDNQQREKLLQKSAEHKRRADDMAEEARLAHADVRRKDEIISRKDEEIGKLREENKRLKEFVSGYKVLSDSVAFLAQRYTANEKTNTLPAVLPPSPETMFPSLTLDEKIRNAIGTMQEEGIFKYAYDYVWVMLVMNQTHELPHFDSTPSFHCFLFRIGVKDLPTLASLKKKTATACRQHPSWTFTDTADTNETRRRNNVASRFLSLIRKGT